MFWIFFSSGIGVLIVIAILVYYFAAGVGELKFAKKEWEIEGLREGFVPQGIAYAKKFGKFLISGYMANGSVSRVYVVGEEQKITEKFVCLKTKDGAQFCGHAGGVAVFNDFGYISSEGKVYRFLISDLINAKNDDEIQFDYEFKTENGADFCTVDGGILWVGEFYKMGKFKTDTTHHILIDGGGQQCAVVFGFRLSENGVPSSVPQKALSVPDVVQGMAFYSGRIFLSASYALNRSRIFEYENVFYKTTSKYIIFKNKKVPLYTLENKFLRKTKIIPPMSEEIVCEGGRIYVLFESAAKKYKFFMRTRIKHVFSIKIY